MCSAGFNISAGTLMSAMSSKYADASRSSFGYRNVVAHSYPRNSPTTPMADATPPPISIHIALSVGEPVKKREMSELNDVAAMKPKIISRMPPTRSASDTALVTTFPL
jgi:hypothetical protein